MSNIAEQFKQKLDEQQSQTVPMVFAGFPCLARRLSLRAYLTCGHIPEALAVIYADDDNTRATARADAFTPEENLAAERFRLDVVCELIVDPKLVRHDGELAADEVRLADVFKVAPKFVAEAYDWFAAGCPDVPVRMEGGEAVHIDDLAKFSEGRPGYERDDARHHAEGDGQQGIEASGDK
jgi:hypothetical protein